MKAWEWKGTNLSSNGEMEFEIVMDMIVSLEALRRRTLSVNEVISWLEIQKKSAEELLMMIRKVELVHNAHHNGSFGYDLIEEWYVKEIIINCTPEQIEFLCRIHQKLNEKRKAEKATELRTAILHCENAGYTVIQGRRYENGG